jgi:hypothetical protein
MEGEGKRAKKIGEHRRVGRFLALGTAGLSGVVALLMVLAPSAAGAGVHPHLVMAPPYLGTSSSGTSYTSSSGCATATGPALTWTSSTGLITGKNAATAKSCKTSTGPVGSSSQGYGQSGVQVGIPFKVATSGSHSVATSLTVTMTSARSATSGGCSKSLANTHPPLYSYSSSYCEAQNQLSFELSASVVDLQNSSWYSNYSYFYNYSYQTWENSTYCYNYGSPYCSNFTGWSNFSFGYGNAQGSFSYTGSGAFTIWTNGTNMVKGHHYVLVISLYIDHGAFVGWKNVAKKWVGAAAASITMSGTGNGAKIASVTVT